LVYFWEIFVVVYYQQEKNKAQFRLILNYRLYQSHSLLIPRFSITTLAFITQTSSIWGVNFRALFWYSFFSPHRNKLLGKNVRNDKECLKFPPLLFCSMYTNAFASLFCNTHTPPPPINLFFPDFPNYFHLWPFSLMYIMYMYESHTFTQFF